MMGSLKERQNKGLPPSDKKPLVEAAEEQSPGTGSHCCPLQTLSGCSEAVSSRASYSGSGWHQKGSGMAETVAVYTACPQHQSLLGFPKQKPRECGNVGKHHFLHRAGAGVLS